jgi:ribosome modulation factor
MERIKKGAELAAWRHGYQAGELTVASLCPYSTGSILAMAWHEGYRKAREEQQSAKSSRAGETMTKAKRVAFYKYPPAKDSSK